MSPFRLATHTAVRPSGLAARTSLVLLAALAGLVLVGRLQVPPPCALSPWAAPPRRWS
jgi:hypothetical protein